MVPIPESARRLLNSDKVAHVITTNANGMPQVSVVWVGTDGDDVVFASYDTSKKIENLRRDLHVVVSIDDPEKTEGRLHRHLLIRGKTTIEAAGAPT